MKDMFLSASHWGRIKLSKQEFELLKKHCAVVEESDCFIIYPFNNR